VLGPKGRADGISDVVSGNDAYANGPVFVAGFTAAKGFDVASGWGTISAPKFVPALVAATRAAKQDRTTRRQAAAELSALGHAVRISPAKIDSKGTAYVFASGFLPGHPVHLLIDGHAVRTLTASVLGTVTYMIDPATLSLSAGSHAVLLESMLIDVRGSFITTSG
jgi:hypothetical protein